MVFSSTTYLFLFFPIVLGGYFILHILEKGTTLKNFFLLLASLVFYAWGEPVYILLMLCSIIVNYSIGLMIAGKYKNLGLVMSIIFNMGALCVFKYSGFIASNLNIILNPCGIVFHVPSIALPIGISFYTFEALSYCIDIYRGDAVAQKNPFWFALFVSFFPHLMAGPVVRYSVIAKNLKSRSINYEDLYEGMRRFVLGLAKKVLIANNVAVVADKVFGLGGSEWTLGLSWIGIICYALQIYFDFGGYSDMAIGLARILGFHLLENFNDPYSARSVQDFWRRWHISLSTWFRDYLYIPLGGNRKGKGRMYLNQIMVFGLCGLWHGANWTFLIWGLWHGAFLCVEKIPVVNRFLQRIPHIQGNIYTLIVVEFGWVFFRANNLRQALTYCSAMLGFGSASGHYAFNEFLSPIPFIAMLAGMVLCIPWKVRLEKVRAKTDLVGIGAENIILLLLLVVCASAVASGTYNPFIYFRF